LHTIDRDASGEIRMAEEATNPATRDRYIINSLIEEAITSSVLEGAATTRKVARDMIRSGRQPRDRSERMIVNNFNTMQRIGDIRAEPLSVPLILDLHRIVTAGTLDDEEAAGRFRRADEHVVVDDMEGEVFHEPPPARELERRVDAMCRFANDEIPKAFVHPVIRAIILHFWLAYDHPFVDGNGRTARALFYWSMLQRGYWLFEFISISSVILKGPAKYARAFLHTETDDNDLTYFILYHLDVIRRSIDELHKYIARRTAELHAIESELRGMSLMNRRQRALLAHALRHPRQDYTIEAHRLSHNVVYQTARTDLLDLQERGLMTARKIGRTWHFTPVNQLERAIRALGA
jgi:Fic family protein